MSRHWRNVGIGAGLLGAGAALSRAWPIVADVTTGKTPEYPDLQPRHYPLDCDGVFEAALGVARRMRLWRIVHVDPALGVFCARATVLPIPFQDEVTVWVEQDGPETIVTARSRSLLKQARGDFGVNARRIRAFLHALDRALGTNENA